MNNMKITKNIISIITFSLIQFNLIQISGQMKTVNPNIPETANLGKYVDFPVSYYTGIPEIEIPLYNLTLNDFNLPVSLNYHAKGIQVGENASCVGLGWNLMAGGCITRVVRHEPDDYNYGEKIRNDRFYYGGPPRSSEHPRLGLFWTGKADQLKAFNLFNESIFDIYYDLRDNITSKYKGFLGDGMNDTEPDLFYFNFAGISGKFVFDIANSARTIRLIPYQDISVSHLIDSGGKLSSFTIIKDGNQYIFDAVEELKITAQTEGFAIQNSIPDIIPTRGGGVTYTTYNSAWYLTKIITKNKHEIKFTYADDEYFEYENRRIKELCINNTIYTDIGVASDNVNLSSASKKRLTQIESDNIKMIFSAEHKRQDSYKTSYAINKISIYSKTGKIESLVKSFDFSYSYFYDANWVKTSYEKILPSLYLESCNKRLKLDAVKESDLPPYKFSYKNQTSLPTKFSYQKDCWGFFNGASTNTSLRPALYYYSKLDYANQTRIYPSINYRELYNDQVVLIEGNNRMPDERFTDTGILTRIIYPTGGYSDYGYESNRFFYDGAERLGGGVRIKYIKKYDNINTNPVTKEYSYTDSAGKSSGRILSIPVFSSKIFTEYSPIVYYIFDTNIANLGSSQGSFVCYTQVVVSENNNGKTEYIYSCPAAYEDTFELIDGVEYKPSPIRHTFIGSTNVDWSKMPYNLCGTTVYNSHPYPPNTEYEWNRGLLLSETVFDKDNNLVKKKEYKYKNYYPNQAKAPISVYGLIYNNDDIMAEEAAFIVVSKYNIFTNVAKVLSEISETDYSLQQSLLNKKTYKYEGFSHINATEERIEKNNGEILTIKYKYVKDYNELRTNTMSLVYEGPTALYTKGINSLVETSTFVEKNNSLYLINSKLSTSNLYEGLALPCREYELEITSPVTDFKESYVQYPGLFVKDSRYVEKRYCSQYDTKGNILEEQLFNTPKICYIWGYNYHYPIGIIENATLNDVKSILGNEILKKLSEGYITFSPGAGMSLTRALSEDEMKIEFEKLRTLLPNAYVTQLLYKPSVGIISMIGPDGMEARYGYDAFGRLNELFRYENNEKRVFKTHNYHFLSQ